MHTYMRIHAAYAVILCHIGQGAEVGFLFAVFLGLILVLAR